MKSTNTNSAITHMPVMCKNWPHDNLNNSHCGLVQSIEELEQDSSPVSHLANDQAESHTKYDETQDINAIWIWAHNLVVFGQILKHKQGTQKKARNFSLHYFCVTYLAFSFSNSACLFLTCATVEMMVVNGGNAVALVVFMLGFVASISLRCVLY